MQSRQDLERVDVRPTATEMRMVYSEDGEFNIPYYMAQIEKLSSEESINAVFGEPGQIAVTLSIKRKQRIEKSNNKKMHRQGPLQQAFNKHHSYYYENGLASNPSGSTLTAGGGPLFIDARGALQVIEGFENLLDILRPVGPLIVAWIGPVKNAIIFQFSKNKHCL